MYKDNFVIFPMTMLDCFVFTGNIVSYVVIPLTFERIFKCLFACLIDCQAHLETAKEARLRTAHYMLREKKELSWRVESQNSALEKVTAGDVTHTNNCMHENQPELNDSWLWVELIYEDAIHDDERSHTATVVHTRTNTSSTHSDVQTHIPLVGSWSKVRMCEICQPIGDWVIEEFDSERNILLPWWWTRRNDTMFSRRKV